MKIAPLLLALALCSCANTRAAPAVDQEPPPATQQSLVIRWMSGASGAAATNTSLTLSGSIWLSSASGPQEDVVFDLPVEVGARIASVVIYGRSGNSPDEVFAGLIVRKDTSGGSTQIGVTKISGAMVGNTEIGWSAADAGFSPSGHEAGDGPYVVQVVLLPTSAAGDVAIYGVRVEYTP